MSIDDNHIWHPYATIPNKVPTYLVDTADGVYLNFKNGARVIDGMSSWWSMIHGYNHGNNILDESPDLVIDSMKQLRECL